MKLRKWAVWSNTAQKYDEKSYFFYMRAIRRKKKIQRSPGYALGIGDKAGIPGFIQMDLVVTVR